jgi:hypothetical protein
MSRTIALERSKYDFEGFVYLFDREHGVRRTSVYSVDVLVQIVRELYAIDATTDDLFFLSHSFPGNIRYGFALVEYWRQRRLSGKPTVVSREPLSETLKEIEL